MALRAKKEKLMDILDRIESLMQENEVSKKSFLESIGHGRSAWSDWRSGRTSTYNDCLDKIADYFDVTTDYLLGRAEVSVPPELNDVQVAFSGGAADGLEQGDIEMLLALARNMQKKNLEK